MPRSSSAPAHPVPRRWPGRPPAPTGGAAELRAWARWLRRRQHATARWRLRVALEEAARPLAAARRALRAIAAQGEDSPAGLVRHLRHLPAMWALDARYDLRPSSYYRFQLFRPERRRDAAHWVDESTYSRVLRRYLVDQPVEHRAITRDKRRFAQWADEHGLPAIPTLLVVEPPPGARGVADPDAPEGAGSGAAPVPTLPPVDLFSKPLDLQGGTGVARWTWVAEGRWRGRDGAERDAAALVAEFRAQARRLAHPILVQEAVRNHPGLTPLSAGGLCTVRMVTVRPLGGGAPRLLAAIFRMPVGDAAADNFDGGGVAAPVDLARGVLGTGRRKAVRHLAAPVERHPTTGAPIPGHPIPDWALGVALVERGHAAMPPTLPIIGWDLAFSDRGPVLVEANNRPDMNLVQAPTETPLGPTPVTAMLLDHVRACFAGGTEAA